MPGSDHILNTYESISATTGHMLEAARNGDWDRLAALERDCRALVEALRSGETTVRLGGDARQRKIEIIRKVLADDAEIRNLTEPWMAELEAFLGSAGRERMIRRAYGSDHGDRT